ncbi:MAG: hypothetical protein R3B65_00520 [Candidatus Paceibacterota bacterium]
MELANTTNTIFSIGTIFIQIVSVLLIVMIFTKDRGNLAKWFSDESLVLVFIIMGGSMLGSLSSILKLSDIYLACFVGIKE